MEFVEKLNQQHLKKRSNLILMPSNFFVVVYMLLALLK